MERLRLQERLSAYEAELLDQIHEAHETDAVAYVSGRPMIHYQQDGEVRHYADCEVVFDMACKVVKVHSWLINPVLNARLDSGFHGEYAAVEVVHPETGDEYIMGIRPKELGFAFRFE